LAALGIDSQEMRIWRQIAVEPSRVVHLWNKTRIGQSRSIVKTESIAPWSSRELQFEAREGFSNPMMVPVEYLLLAGSQDAAQISANSIVVDGVEISSNQVSEGPGFSS
jgi:hypothetical protein